MDIMPVKETVPIDKGIDVWADFVNGHILYVDGGILAYIGKQP